MSAPHIALLLIAAALAHSQTFEAASVRASGTQSRRGSEGGPGSPDPTRYTFHRATLRDLIALAWDVDYWIGMASKMPLDRQAFDISAKLAPGTTREQFRVMLQNFLEERFHLKQHLDTRALSGYELVVAKGGPRLNHPAPPNDDSPELPPGPGIRARMSAPQNGYQPVHLRVQQKSMAEFANWLQLFSRQPVVDRTGVAGTHDFTLEFSREMGASADASASVPSGLPDLLTAVKQQLGLELVAGRVPTRVLVVDSVDKEPTEN